tara:strand:+ start:835 stop:1287 length:453 start_codon:yes stop_codon:yes gene_type:complete
MPREDVVVVKRTTLEALQFMEEKMQSDANALVFTMEEQMSFGLPYQRQERPFVSIHSTPSTSPSTTPLRVSTRVQYTRTSRSVERELLAEALRIQDDNLSDIGKYNRCITAKCAKLVVNKNSMLTQLNAVNEENDLLRKVVGPLARLIVK